MDEPTGVDDPAGLPDRTRAARPERQRGARARDGPSPSHSLCAYASKNQKLGRFGKSTQHPTPDSFGVPVGRDIICPASASWRNPPQSARGAQSRRQPTWPRHPGAARGRGLRSRTALSRPAPPRPAPPALRGVSLLGLAGRECGSTPSNGALVMMEKRNCWV